VFATSPPGDTDRLFILEQHSGRIEILDLGTNTISATPFLDLDGLATDNEQGLLGLAFDPNYATNGYFYVNFNTSADGGDTHIQRFSVSGDPNVADAASGVDILTFNQPQSNHNGGWIGFRPGDPLNLYIATGDGGGGNDDDAGHTTGTGNAQDTTDNLLGKILRINPSREAMVATPYTNPGDNPFVGEDGDDEIWTYGLRNPYRASFDHETGDLWIGDVGQGLHEEIDFQPADSDGGENYGWRLREGTEPTPGSVGGPPPVDNVEPVYDYDRGSDPFEGTTVIGGYVYRGPVAELGGHYIFGDAGSNHFWKLDPHAVDIPASVTNIDSDLAPDVSSISGLGSFGEDELGNLYIMEVFGGELFRLTSNSEDAVWNGDAAIGNAGDGTNWSDANNWTRGGAVDTAFATDDHVVFTADSSTTTVDLEADRTVAAVTFQSDFTLQNNELEVLSGNVTVEAGVTAAIQSNLVAETVNHSIRKLGEGTLLVDGDAGQIAVLAGSLGGSGTFDHLTVAGGATVAPGASIGTLVVDDSFTLGDGGTLAIEIGETDSDLVQVGGDASLAGGGLSVSLFTGAMPMVGSQFEILDVAGSLDGEFAGLGENSIVATTGGELFRISYLGGDGNDVVLTLIPEPTTALLAAAMSALLLGGVRRSW
jgi:hypothetical protein